MVLLYSGDGEDWRNSMNGDLGDSYLDHGSYLGIRQPYPESEIYSPDYRSYLQHEEMLYSSNQPYPQSASNTGDRFHVSLNQTTDTFNSSINSSERIPEFSVPLERNYNGLVSSSVNSRRSLGYSNQYQVRAILDFWVSIIGLSN